MAGLRPPLGASFRAAVALRVPALADLPVPGRLEFQPLRAGAAFAPRAGEWLLALWLFVTCPFELCPLEPGRAVFPFAGAWLPLEPPDAGACDPLLRFAGPPEDHRFPEGVRLDVELLRDVVGRLEDELRDVAGRPSAGRRGERVLLLPDGDGLRSRWVPWLPPRAKCRCELLAGASSRSR